MHKMCLTLTLRGFLSQSGDAYNRTLMTPTVKTWMGRWLEWQRG